MNAPVKPRTFRHPSRVVSDFHAHGVRIIFNELRKLSVGENALDLRGRRKSEF